MSKYAILGIFLQAFLCSFLLAEEGRAQKASLEKVAVSANIKNRNLEQVFSILERKTGFYFTYDRRLIDLGTTFDKQFTKESLADILRSISAETDLRFKRVNDNIYVIKKEPRESTEAVEESYVGSIQRLVTGTVTAAEDNQGLPGVSVILKGTATGTTTDIDGKFAIEVNEGATLMFSFIGFLTQEVEVGNRSQIDVVLEPDMKQLEEVIVVGYGQQKKATITGSVTSVKGEELVQSPALNLSNSLAGRMPGVVAVNRSGEPGYDGSAIRIRGSNTTGNNDALIVIDGIPARAGGFERLNPADIESISVLKDASAAIYGARAANGVILITTKRGKTGKPELSYSMNQGWAQPTVIPKLANATQFAEMRNDLEIYNLPVSEWQNATNAFRETGNYLRPNGSTISAPYSPDDFQKFRAGTDPWTHPDTDWYDETLKTWSPQSRHTLQLNGGTENFTYMASLGYQNQDAYYKDAATGYKQYDMRINLDGHINKYIKTSIGVVGRQENRFFPTRSAGSIFRMQMRGIPTQPAFWPNGLPGPDIENGENPVVITTNQTGYDRDTRYYFQTNGSVEVSIPWVEGLKFTGTASLDKYVRQTKRWETPWYLYTWDGNSYEDDGVTPRLSRGQRGPAEPRLNQGNEDQLNMLLGGILSYDKSIGNHNFNVLAGINKETIENESFNAFRRYFISTAIDQIFAGGDAERNNGGSAFERARLNYFGRVAYNYNEKYLAEFLWRYDGSYMFPEETRYGFFPGVMAGWVISEENFFQNSIPVVNFLKLRGSWGQMGNDNITLDWGSGLLEYQYLSTYGFRSYIIGGQEEKTLFETRVPNRNITWEVSNNTNIGIEGGLFDGRVFFEVDMFWNKRTNMLRQRSGSIPRSTGMTLPPENIGEVQNKGWEFNVGYNGEAGQFRYNVSVNGGYAQNKILFWDEPPGAPAWQRSTGMPMYTYNVYQYDGVFRDQAEIDANTLDYSAITNTLRPGDMKFKDVDGDGRITPDDMVRNRFTNIPLFQGGLNIGMQFRNFDLAILFQGAAGAMVPVSTGESGNIGNFLLDVYENRWTVDNPSSEHPRIANRSDQYFSGGNDYWLRSADYIRLKNFEIGYTLPLTLTQKAGINNLRFYINGLNLLTMDKLKVYDPESTGGTGQYYPQARIINSGLTLVF